MATKGIVDQCSESYPRGALKREWISMDKDQKRRGEQSSPRPNERGEESYALHPQRKKEGEKQS
jgi:hypothetical protein